MNHKNIWLTIISISLFMSGMWYATNFTKEINYNNPLVLTCTLFLINIMIIWINPINRRYVKDER